MGANQNSSPEFGLCPKINPKSTLFSLDQDSTAIAKLSALGAWLGNVAEHSVNETTREIDNKNRLEKQFVSSQAFHRTPGGRVRETTAGERFRPRILKTFDSVGQWHA
jgi:hypothetical protein